MHRNAPLTPEGRMRLCHRIQSGWSITAAAESMNISRQTASKWWGRFVREGDCGLVDRSSRPSHSPNRTPTGIEARILRLRAERKLGPARIGGILGVPASSVHRVLVRAGVNRLRWLDRPTGRPVRRIHTTRCGELIHIDVKKLARIPDGGGHRMLGDVAGRPNQRARAGYTHIHSAIDDHTRLAYSEIHPDETGATCAGFLERAAGFFATCGITRTQRVMTDNAFCYRLSHDFQAVMARLGARHVLIRPHCPWQNGKVERLNRTLLREWAYSQVFTSNAQRADLLPEWLTYYNTIRRHSALGGKAPISRLSTT